MRAVYANSLGAWPAYDGHACARHTTCVLCCLAALIAMPVMHGWGWADDAFLPSMATVRRICGRPPCRHCWRTRVAAAELPLSRRRRALLRVATRRHFPSLVCRQAQEATPDSGRAGGARGFVIGVDPS